MPELGLGILGGWGLGPGPGRVPGVLMDPSFKLSEKINSWFELQNMTPGQKLLAPLGPVDGVGPQLSSIVKLSTILAGSFA